MRTKKTQQLDPAFLIDRLGQELSEELYVQEVLNALDYCFSLVGNHQQHVEPSADRSQGEAIQIFTEEDIQET